MDLNQELLTLEVKTKSIELTLVPLVTQITTLMNAKEKPMKSEKTVNAILHIGQAVICAVQKFVSIGEAIADDNIEIRSQMYEACRSASVAGNAIRELSDVQASECGHFRFCTDKNRMLMAARSLLSSITNVLLLADTVTVKQIIIALNKVSNTLNQLQHAANFSDFVKGFSLFGGEMVELAHRTGDRQNDLKDDIRRSQMIVGRQILERSMMLLLTSSKVCFRHPECIASRENKDSIFYQMYQALELIAFIIKDGAIDKSLNFRHVVQNENYFSTSTTLCEKLDQPSLYSIIKQFEDYVEITRLTLVGPSYRERLTRALCQIMDKINYFTDSPYTSHAHREKILLSCEHINTELNQLLHIGVMLDQAGHFSPIEDLETPILQVLRASNDLKCNLKITALEQTQEVIKVFEKIEIFNSMKTSISTGDHESLSKIMKKFKDNAERAQDACRLLQHIEITESCQVTLKCSEWCLKLFAAQVLNACQTVADHPLCEISKENLDAFLETWTTLFGDVISVYNEIGELYSHDFQNKTCYMSLPRPGKHGLTIKQVKASKLDSEEQAKIAKLGLEMKLLTSELNTETDRWPSSQNELCKRARHMSHMAFSMYQFTRGEGNLKTTQDLFTQAEFFADEANRLYKFARPFSYQVPVGQHKNELLEYLDNIPPFVQQLHFTVKGPTVGKAATFTKVDNVIQGTKKLMNVISKVVTICLFCSTQYKVDFHNLKNEIQPLPVKSA